MTTDNSYKVHCDCGSVELTLLGSPVVQAVCHCEDCRELLDIPFNALTAWETDAAIISKGEHSLLRFDYPGKTMSRYHCKHCGEMMFNTNVYGWRLVSQALLRKCHDNQLPAALKPDKHFYYEERVVDIKDPLPKFLQGVDGPLYED